MENSRKEKGLRNQKQGQDAGKATKDATKSYLVEVVSLGDDGISKRNRNAIIITVLMMYTHDRDKRGRA